MSSFSSSASLPYLLSAAGEALAETLHVSELVLSLALHVAAGIVLAVVGLELMPEALQASPPWIPLLAFVGGGAAFIGLDHIVGYVQARIADKEKKGGSLAIFSGVSMDLFSDGMLIGTGTALDPALGLLAIGQVPPDVPEGFAAIASMRRAGISRRRRVLLSVSFAVPIFRGATLGYFALRDAPDIITLSVLALTGGALTAVVLEEMIGEAHEGETSRLGPIFLTAGFALFGAISVYVSA